MARTASAFACVVLIASGLLAWHWLGDSASRSARWPRDFRAGKAPRRACSKKSGAVPDELRESSGLAISRTQPGVLWSHNDSGDGPNLYAIDISGKLLASVPGGRCDGARLGGHRGGSMSVGDRHGTGRIRSAHRNVSSSPIPVTTIRSVPTSRSTSSSSLASAVLASSPAVAARTLRYRYPSGPTDAEALAVRPNGDLTIVSKGRSGTINFFSIPAASVDESDRIRRDRHGDVCRQHRDSTRSANRPTGDRRGRVARRDDARRAHLLRGVLLQARDTSRGESLGGYRRSCALGDAEPQGEAIDYLDAKTLLLTSERSRGRPGSIHRLQC